jgi:hypothetical protein
MTSKNPKAGADFTDLTVKLLDDTYELCEETYAATQEPLPADKVQNLIKRSEAHIAAYNALLEQYTGGRKDAIKQAGPHIGRLIEFTDSLKKSAKKSS